MATLKDCYRCGMSPQKCADKVNAAVAKREAEQAQRWPDLTPQQVRDDLSRAAHMNACCVNCSHF